LKNKTEEKGGRVRILVLIKQVPNTTKVRLDPKTGNLIREGVEAIINPEDVHALEAAISLREALGPEAGSSVTVLTMGPPQAVDVLTEALGMGADKAVLLTDRLFAGADTWATSTVLARAVEYLSGAELIICGRQAIDGDTAQIGPQVAEELGLNQATYVTALELTKGKLVATRKLDLGQEELELTLPALVTVMAELNRPRYPVVGRLLAGCEPAAPIRVLNASDLGLKMDQVGLPGSLTQVVKTFSPKEGRQTEMLDGTPAEMAARLKERLIEAKVLSRDMGAREVGAREEAAQEGVS
jgi:electron transfer flavoprotein beta subunit